MPTNEKINIVKETTDRLKKSSGVYFTKYTGLDVPSITSLRKSFTSNSVQFNVIKNTLTKIAAKNAGKGLFMLSPYLEKIGKALIKKRAADTEE